MHPHALMAAEAAEAAGAQGRFWEMHPTLFANQRALEREALITYADELGLDLRSFVRDLDSHIYGPRIRRDFMSGVRSGVNGTPTFFINGYRYDGVFNAEALIAALTGAAPREAPESEELV
jgi:protein-disulfide isomerase